MNVTGAVMDGLTNLLPMAKTLAQTVNSITDRPTAIPTSEEQAVPFFNMKMAAVGLAAVGTLFTLIYAAKTAIQNRRKAAVTTTLTDELAKFLDDESSLKDFIVDDVYAALKDLAASGGVIPDDKKTDNAYKWAKFINDYGILLPDSKVPEFVVEQVRKPLLEKAEAETDVGAKPDDAGWKKAAMEFLINNWQGDMTASLEKQEVEETLGKYFGIVSVLVGSGVFNDLLLGRTSPATDYESLDIAEYFKALLPYYQAEDKKGTFNPSVTLVDDRGSRIDFSSNPKAVLAPPRSAKRADLGTVDQGLLGDFYVCGFNANKKRAWMLMPSCLNTTAKNKIFKDSVVRIKRPASKENNNRHFLGQVMLL